MPIGMMDDRSPRVEAHDGRVAIWGEVAGEDDQCGLLLSAPSAATAAVKILRVVSELRGDDIPGFPAGSITVDHRVLDDGEDVVRISFDIEGAPLAAFVGLTQLAEITAAFTLLSRELDRSPRLDG